MKIWDKKVTCQSSLVEMYSQLAMASTLSDRDTDPTATASIALPMI